MWRRRLKIFLLFSGDILIFYISLALALAVRYVAIEQDLPSLKNALPLHFIPFTIIFLTWLIIFWTAGLYDLTHLRNSNQFYQDLIAASIFNAAIAIAFFYFIPYFRITPKINLFLDLAITLMIIGWWRKNYNNWLQKSLKINILLLGIGDETMELKKYLSQHPQIGYNVVAVVAPDNIQEIENLTKSHHVSLVVSSYKFDYSSGLTRALLEFLKRGINITDLDAFYEDITGRVPLSIIREVWFLENIGKSQREFFKIGKRIADVIGAIILGLVTLVLSPFVILAIELSYPGPIFYRQRRIGFNNKEFILTKFRSLDGTIKKDDEMKKPEEEEITRVGRFLRKTHIDELPQVWNVLLGQMSFIGPRPEKPDFVKKLSAEIPFYDMRNLVKPGIAGWAQLNNPYAGPSVKDTIEKLQYDLYYIKNRSIFLDFKILFKTLRHLFSGAGL